MKTRAALVLLPLALLSGCADGDGQAGTETTASAGNTASNDASPVPSGEETGPDAAGAPTSVEGQPDNPVPILEKIDGCELEAGTSTGEYDFNGNRYASCYFMDNAGTMGTNVTVRTLIKGFDTSQYQDMRPDDSHKVIQGEDFYAVITGDWSTYSSNVDPEAIARQIGGKVVPAS